MNDREDILLTRIARLEKMVNVLMDRAELGVPLSESDFGLFQMAAMLEEQVRLRTAELEEALAENKRINIRLHASEARFRALVDQSLVGIVLLEGGRYSYSNQRFNEIFGYDEDEIRGMDPLVIVAPKDRPMLSELLGRRTFGEVTRVHFQLQGLTRQGEAREIEVYGNTIELTGQRILINVVLDITERVRAERELQVLRDRLREQSIRDALTGLYNRRYLEETLGRELSRVAREHSHASLIMCDLDHFKAINDEYGHPAGDDVIRCFAKMLRGSARREDIICRYGGEEFLLFMPRMDEERALKRAEHLRVKIESTPVMHQGASIKVTASFGIASYHGGGEPSESLVERADQALYRAKTGGRNRVIASSGAPGLDEA